ncbi:MAG: ribosomal RNA small subunit methyltransferase A [Candidatus Diapherotrites archaeon]|nr:ribosomal RNA small subunit methyltransferase A [Candidatus Diapherotrites archaeon]
MDLFQELNKLMAEYSFAPSRAKAQNFVISESLLKKMVEAAQLDEKDVVLEIGAGTGFLTRALLSSSKVVAFELDDKLFGLLLQNFSKEISLGKLRVFGGNFLEHQLQGFNKVVSLPPYTISSQMMFKLLSHDFELGVMVFQREFVDKCLSRPGFKEFCPIAVLVDYYFDSEVLVGNISPENFFPKPSAFSTMIRLLRKKNVARIKRQGLFEHFLKQVFRYKNKNLRNALHNSFSFFKTRTKMDKKEFEETVSKLRQSNSKVYLVESADFVEIFEKIFE